MPTLEKFDKSWSTGASSGMGKEIAKRLIEDGYQVYAAARHVDRMDERAKLGAKPMRMHISRESEIKAAADAIAEKYWMAASEPRDRPLGVNSGHELMC